MTDIKSMTREELGAAFAAMGQPRFRAGQVFAWLHRGVRSFDEEEMTNLPKALRERLASEYELHLPEVARKQVSARDGTVKYLWRLRDGHCVESVLMRYHHGNTVCISSEVGCAMGCAFCASTRGGLVRRLRPSEMLDQVLFTQLDSGAVAGTVLGWNTIFPISRFTSSRQTLVILSPVAASITIMFLSSGFKSLRRHWIVARTASEGLSTDTTTLWLPSESAFQVPTPYNSGTGTF